MIASKLEIRSLAFSRNFDIDAVKDNVILLVELEQVKPLLGSLLYADVVANPSSHTELIALLKPFIAYNLKYYIEKGNHVKTGNKGAQTAQGTNETQANVEDAKREALTFANKYRSQIVSYLRENNLYFHIERNDIINGIIIM